MPIKHRYTNTNTDGADATVIQPSDWNDDHVYPDGEFDISKLAPEARGMEFLASNVLATAANTMSVGAFTAKDIIQIFIMCPGTAVTDLLALRFNADTGATCWNRRMRAAQGTGLFTNTQAINDTQIILHEQNSTAQRGVTLIISNRLATSKIVQGSPFFGTNTAATPAEIGILGGEWVNTTAQITTLVLRTVAGNNMLAGTQMNVMGKDFP